MERTMPFKNNIKQNMYPLICTRLIITVYMYINFKKITHFQFVNIMRYLQTYNVIFRSAVKSVSRLFLTFNGLTDDKAESNVICY